MSPSTAARPDKLMSAATLKRLRASWAEGSSISELTSRYHVGPDKVRKLVKGMTRETKAEPRGLR